MNLRQTLAATFCLLLAAGAGAQVINIDSRYGFRYDGGGSDPAPVPGQHINLIGAPLVQLTLGPGDYIVTNAAGRPGALFTAWSYNVGSASWGWAFVVADDATRQVVLYGEGGRGSSAAEVAALPAVQNFSAGFTLAATTTLDFTLRDYYVADNAGGISLSIAPAAAVPEPASALLISIGLCSLIGRLRILRHRRARPELPPESARPVGTHRARDDAKAGPNVAGGLPVVRTPLEPHGCGPRRRARALTFGTRAWLAGLVCAALCGAATPLWASGSIPGQGTWETTLLGRDIDGQPVPAASAQAVFLYDTRLDATWLRGTVGVSPPGSWLQTKAWLENLVVGNFDDWRLPRVNMPPGLDSLFGCQYSVAGGTPCGYNVLTTSDGVVYSELADLWYVTLGNKALCPPGDAACHVPPDDFGLRNVGPFANLQPFSYWTGWYGLLAFGPNGHPVGFDADTGEQRQYQELLPLTGLAVRDGDVLAAVPEPATVLLWLSGLGVVLAVQRRKPLSAPAPAPPARCPQ